MAGLVIDKNHYFAELKKVETEREGWKWKFLSQYNQHTSSRIVVRNQRNHIKNQRKKIAYLKSQIYMQDVIDFMTRETRKKYMRKPKQLKKRVWLNSLDCEDTGAMSISLSIDQEAKLTKQNLYVNAYLVVRDCSRQINLDFSVYGSHKVKDGGQQAKFDKRIKKLKHMEDFIRHLREKLEEVKDFHAQLPEECPDE